MLLGPWGGSSPPSPPHRPRAVFEPTDRFVYAMSNSMKPSAVKNSPEDPAHSSTSGQTVTLNISDADSLSAVNHVVEMAVGAWPQPERVRRLALPVHRYSDFDALEFEFLGFEAAGALVGMAAWETLVTRRGPRGEPGALLHGLYVRPEWQLQGVGQTLQREMASRAAAAGAHGILLRAERVSVSYFERCEFQRVTATPRGEAGYPYLFWKPLRPEGEAEIFCPKKETL